MFDKYFSGNFTLETPRVLLEPVKPTLASHSLGHPSTEGIGNSRIIFNITDLHTKTICGTAEYNFRELPIPSLGGVAPPVANLHNNSSSGGAGVGSVPSTVEISWSWNDPEDADQGLIKNLKFVMLSYGFQVMKLDKITLTGDGSMTIKREEWQSVKETFFPELM